MLTNPPNRYTAAVAKISEFENPTYAAIIGDCRPHILLKVDITADPVPRNELPMTSGVRQYNAAKTEYCATDTMQLKAKIEP